MPLVKSGFFALMLTALATPARAQQCSPDQGFDPTPITLSQGIGFTDKAQTFTVAVSGLLEGVQVYVDRNIENADSLFVDVRRTIAGTPIEEDSIILASRVVPPSEITTRRGFIWIDLSHAGVGVSAGEVLAVVCRAGSDANTHYSWGGRSGDPLPGGRIFFRNVTAGITTWTSIPDGDLGFWTFVCTPTPVSRKAWGRLKVLYR